MNNKYKVLVVDDIELNRDILGDILEDSYDVLFAENGKTALEIIEENKDEASKTCMLGISLCCTTFLGLSLCIWILIAILLILLIIICVAKSKKRRG